MAGRLPRMLLELGLPGSGIARASSPYFLLLAGPPGLGRQQSVPENRYHGSGHLRRASGIIGPEPAG